MNCQCSFSPFRSCHFSLSLPEGLHVLCKCQPWMCVFLWTLRCHRGYSDNIYRASDHSESPGGDSHAGVHLHPCPLWHRRTGHWVVQRPSRHDPERPAGETKEQETEGGLVMDNLREGFGDPTCRKTNMLVLTSTHTIYVRLVLEMLFSYRLSYPHCCSRKTCS